jgi:biotin transport system substrate-specific component
MQATLARYDTLVERMLPSEGARAWMRDILLAIAGTALITLSAKINIPFYPVPMTMQTFAILVLAMAYGPRLGAATLALYIAEGAVGLPVFAGTPEKGIGLAYLMGPTGGYILGFLLAAMLVGWFAERGFDRSPARASLAMLAGNIVIYVPGLLWLGAVAGWDKPVLAWGLYPFVLGDLFKIALGAALLPGVWALIGRKNG